jgi:hypothetical protein
MADCKPAVETGDLSLCGHQCGDAVCIAVATALAVASQSKKISWKFRFLEFRIMLHYHRLYFVFNFIRVSGIAQSIYI